MDYYEQERLLMNAVNGVQPFAFRSAFPARKLYYAGTPITAEELASPLTLRPCVVVDYNSELQFGIGPWMAMLYQAGNSVYFYEDAKDVEGIGELLADGQQEEISALRQQRGS